MCDNKKITKSFDGSSESEILNGGHTINWCSWERLKPYLESAAGAKEIKGVMVLKY